MKRFNVIMCSLVRYWYCLVPLATLWVAMFLAPSKVFPWLIVGAIGIQFMFVAQHKHRLMTGIAIGAGYGMNSYLPVMCNYKSPKSVQNLLRKLEIILLELGKRTSPFSSTYMLMCFFAYSVKNETSQIPQPLAVCLKHKEDVEVIQHRKVLLWIYVLPFLAIYTFCIACVSPVLALTAIVPVGIFDIVSTDILDVVSIDTFLKYDDEEVSEDEMLVYRNKSKMFNAFCTYRGGRTTWR